MGQGPCTLECVTEAVFAMLLSLVGCCVELNLPRDSMYVCDVCVLDTAWCGVVWRGCVCVMYCRLSVVDCVIADALSVVW